MKYDTYGQVVATTQDLCNILYRNPDAELDRFVVEDHAEFNRSVRSLHYDAAMLSPYRLVHQETVDEFDTRLQATWHMPAEYYDLDIAKWLLDQCQTPEELQRVGQELLLYQERNLFRLLQYLKYLVDTLRANQIVWGVGRGSSVASYVLYLIGVHKINSIRYELDIEEFLK